VPPGLVTAKEAAIDLGVSYDTLAGWLTAGRLKSTVYAEGPKGNQYKAIHPADLRHFKLTPFWREYVSARKARALRAAERAGIIKLTAREQAEEERGEQLKETYKDDEQALRNYKRQLRRRSL